MNNFSFVRQSYDLKHENFIFDPQDALRQPLPIGRGLFKTRYQVLFDFLKKIDISHFRLLDVGTGSGKLVFTLRNKITKLYGIDFSHVALNQAQKIKSILPKEEQNRIFFAQANIERGLPFQNFSFDAVLLLAVLEHVFNPFRTLKEIKRVLKKDGILILSVPNIAFLKQRIRLLFGKLPLSQPVSFDIKYWENHLWDGGHIHYFTKDTLEKLLRHVGFEVIKWDGEGSVAKIGKFNVNLLYTAFVIFCKSI